MASSASITSTATAATATASVELLMTEGCTTMRASPTTVTAPMAVKCSPQIAVASNAGAIHSALRRSSSCQASSAAEASAMPIAIEARTRPRSQPIVPGIMRARIPVKCMRAMPPPMTAPPAATIGRPPRAAIAKPATDAMTAISSEAIVKAAS